MSNPPREPMIAVMAALAAAISLLEHGGKKAAPSDRMFYMMLNDYRRALDNARTALDDAAPAPPATDDLPTMDDAIAAGDGTLHGAIDHWQGVAQRQAREAECFKVECQRLLKGSDALREIVKAADEMHKLPTQYNLDEYAAARAKVKP